MERHTLLLRRDVQWEHIRQEHEARVSALKHFDATEKNHRRQQYHGIRTDICPKTYYDDLDRLRNRVCDGTGGWLLSDPTFSRWLDAAEKSSRIFWLQGIPGAGMLNLCPFKWDIT